MALSELNPKLQSFIVEATGSVEERSEQTKKLREFGIQLKDEKDKELSRWDSYRPLDPAKVCHLRQHLLLVLNAFHKEAEKRACDSITGCCDEVMELVVELLQFLHKNPRYSVTADNFIRDMSTRLKTHQKLKQLKYYRQSLKTKVRWLLKQYPALDYTLVAKSELGQCYFLYESELNYPQPSPFDDAIPLYIAHAGLTPMVDPIVTAILDGSIQSALLTIAEFSDLLKEGLITKQSPIHNVIIYTAVVRYVFNEAYLKRNDLNAGARENAEFLEKAMLFREQTIRQLTIPERIQKKYAPNMTISGLFNKKQQMMIDNLQFLTNPIDLLMTLHKAQQEIARYFGDREKRLEFQETTTLMLALLAVNPPSNAISIARFLTRWKELTIFEDANNARNLFISAIQRICAFECEYEYEEDDE